MTLRTVMRVTGYAAIVIGLGILIMAWIGPPELATRSVALSCAALGLAGLSLVISSRSGG